VSFSFRPYSAASDGVLIVAADCLHIGGRAPAKLLRRKIQSLLPAMVGESLILDLFGSNPHLVDLAPIDGREPRKQ